MIKVTSTLSVGAEPTHTEATLYGAARALRNNQPVVLGSVDLAYDLLILLGVRPAAARQRIERAIGKEYDRAQA